MKISMETKVDFDIELKDVLAFLIEEKLSAEQYDLIVLEALRRKKGYFTMVDQEKYELFDKNKDRFSLDELEDMLK